MYFVIGYMFFFGSVFIGLLLPTQPGFQTAEKLTIAGMCIGVMFLLADMRETKRKHKELRNRFERMK